MIFLLCFFVIGVNRNTKKDTVVLPDVCSGKPLRYHYWDTSEIEILSQYDLLSTKDIVYLVNVSTRDYLRNDNKWLDALNQEFENRGRKPNIRLISIEFEDKLSEMRNNGELDEYLIANSTHTSYLQTLIQECYRIRNLISFFTFTDGELKCWSIQYGKSLHFASSLVDVNLHRYAIYVTVTVYLVTTTL